MAGRPHLAQPGFFICFPSKIICRNLFQGIFHINFTRSFNLFIYTHTYYQQALTKLNTMLRQSIVFVDVFILLCLFDSSLPLFWVDCSSNSLYLINKLQVPLVPKGLKLGNKLFLLLHTQLGRSNIEMQELILREKFYSRNSKKCKFTQYV